MVKAKLIVNTSGADQLFKKMGWTIKNSVPGFLRQEARLVAVSLAFQTQPFGDNATSRAVGMAAVDRDIYRVYATPGMVFNDISDAGAQSGFWKAVKTSAWDRAQKICSRASARFKSIVFQQFDGGQQHRQLRNNQGRIPPSQKPIMVVKNPEAVKSYVLAEQKKVGFGKGGWASCARALGGTRGIPGWVSRQDAPGMVIENYRSSKSSVAMTNLVPYASEIISESGIRDAIAIAQDRLRKSVAAAFRRSRNG